MKYKEGHEVFVTSRSNAEGFDYTLSKQDIIDIKTGEWADAGLKIIDPPTNGYSYWKHLLINLRYAFWIMRK